MTDRCETPCFSRNVFARSAFEFSFREELQPPIECLCTCVCQDQISISIRTALQASLRVEGCDETGDPIPDGSPLLLDLTHHFRVLPNPAAGGATYVGHYAGTFEIGRFDDPGIAFIHGSISGIHGMRSESQDCHDSSHGEGMLNGSVIHGNPKFLRCGLTASLTSKLELPDPAQVPPEALCNDRELWLRLQLSLMGFFVCACSS